MAEVISLADRRNNKADAAKRQAEAERAHAAQQAAAQQAQAMGNIHRSGSDDQKKAYALHQRHRRQLGDVILGQSLYIHGEPVIDGNIMTLIVGDGTIKREVTISIKDATQ